MGVSAEKYQQSLDFLFGRLNYERMGSSKYSTSDFKLGRMENLLEILGNPQNQNWPRFISPEPKEKAPLP